MPLAVVRQMKFRVKNIYIEKLCTKVMDMKMINLSSVFRRKLMSISFYYLSDNSDWEYGLPLMKLLRPSVF